ncbi:MAG: DUF4390 domain-containing protein [Spirochaetes bacterium]|nr:DUF4390 domain-containing protein [Spirochaetota bacterium]
MKIRPVFLTIIAVFVLQAGGAVCAENLSVQFHSNTVEQGSCHTDFSLNGYITYDTVDAIKNGITAKLKVTFQLIRSEGFRGLGQNVLREKVRSLYISYDVWEDSFVIENEDPKSVYYVEKEGNIIRMVNEIISPIVIDASPLNVDGEVVLRAKIYIETIKLYPPFGIFLYFFDPWNYESDWIYSSSFSLKK